MSETTEFTGLTMPVFTAFGWAGEENALKFALAQLELFVQHLHANLPYAARVDLPHFGLSRENRTVYLAVEPDIEKDVHITFNARPMSFELLVAVVDTDVLARTWKLMLRDLPMTMALLNKLDSNWTLRVQQMQLVEGTDEPIHYQDLYKDVANKLDDNAAQVLFEKAAYLNGEEKWITPIYLSQRIASEKVAAMGRGVTQVLSERLAAMMPLVMLLGGRTAGQRAKGKGGGKAKKPTAVSGETIAPVAKVEAGDGQKPLVARPNELFSYVATLKPLHLRRGFINMTPEHWPLFAEGARSETRRVIVKYGAETDKNSSVWRLQPSDMARLVLSPPVHEWLEDHFQAEENIRLAAVENQETGQITVYLETA